MNNPDRGEGRYPIVPIADLAQAIEVMRTLVRVSPTGSDGQLEEVLVCFGQVTNFHKSLRAQAVTVSFESERYGIAFRFLDGLAFDWSDTSSFGFATFREG